MPMNLSVFITTVCNMSCRFCGSSRYKKGEKYIPFKDMCYILNEGKKFGFKYLTLSGGEPFLHQDIDKIIDYADKIGYWIEVTTNAAAITRQRVKAMVNKKLIIRISIHAGNARLHDQIAGGNAFEKLLNAIEELKANDVWFSFSSTVFDANIDEIEDLVKFARDAGGLYIRFQPLSSIYNARDIVLGRDFYERLLTSIISISIRFKNFFDFKIKNDTFMLNPIEILATRRCAGGSSTAMTIDTDRSIIPCPIIPPDAKIPGIKFNSVSDFYRMKSLMDDLFNNELLDNLKGECRECVYKTVCYGGCISAKVTRGLEISDAQPLCFRNILNSVLQKFDSKDTDEIVNNWYYRYCQRTTVENKNKECMRRGPIWELHFKRNGEQRYYS